jgi:hypothetical protein
VCRLSIIIPLCADDEQFEDTLVSVLQHRPRDCEVVVVHAVEYADPYELRDEVRFVRAAQNASPVRMVNAGCDAARGEILHVVQPGVLAGDGWTENALKSFDDLQICSVAPLVVDAADPDLIVAAGLRYTRGGRRMLYGAGRRVSESRRLFQRPILGPALLAGFYRRWVWDAMGGFCEQLDAAWTDADFSLSLKSLGYRSVLDPECVLRSSAATVRDAGSFRSGYDAEQVFWRHAAAQGWLGSLMMHPGAVMGDVLRDGKRPGAYLHLLGRCAALFTAPKHLTHAARVRQAFEWFLLEKPPAATTRRLAHPEREASANRRLPGYRDAA